MGVLVVRCRQCDVVKVKKELAKLVLQLGGSVAVCMSGLKLGSKGYTVM